MQSGVTLPSKTSTQEEFAFIISSLICLWFHPTCKSRLATPLHSSELRKTAPTSRACKPNPDRGDNQCLENQVLEYFNWTGTQSEFPTRSHCPTWSLLLSSYSLRYTLGQIYVLILSGVHCNSSKSLCMVYLMQASVGLEK